jgi:glutamyl-tRNA synthetase
MTHQLDSDARDVRKADGEQPARVRFAPSPTGYLHLGGLRTALFGWLWARHTGGQFILRIEDTDQKRYNPDSLADLMRGLRWLGLDWDEGPDVGGPYGPYVQSERKEIYAEHVQYLLDTGHAYRCYCTSERLTALREEQRKNKQRTGYDRHCRYLTPEERAAKEAEGLPSVVRLAVPEAGATTFVDLLRGKITTDNEQLEDAVLLKSDGLPTYHLAVVVDDHLMKITHVLRGQEWLASAPLHQLLYDAFGWQPPVFVHLPVILDPSGKGKMSKRKKVVAGKEYLALVHEFIDAGYLPEAMFNFLVNVGWNYDPEQEVFTREEAIERFNLEDINPSPAALPYEKLDWLNGIYIRQLPPAELKERLLPFLSRQLGLDVEALRADPRLDKLVPVIQERIKRLDEAVEWIDWAFLSAEQIAYTDPSLLLGRKLDVAQSVAVLEAGEAILATIEPFEPDTIQAAFRAKAEEMGLKAGSFFGPFRGAISGKKVSPPLFESMDALGREEVLRRVKRAKQVLQEALTATD